MKFRLDVEKELLIVSEATRVEYHQLKLHLTREVKNAKYQQRVKMKLWDGTITHFKDGQIQFGLWKECFSLCKINNWKFEIENQQDFPLNRDITYSQVEGFCKEFFKNHRTKDGKPFIPYDHQIQSAYKILKNRYCLTEVATGGGKSLIFAIIAFYILKNIKTDAKFLLIVPNISLVTQFFDDIMDYNKGFKDENIDNALPIHMEEIMSDNPRRSEHQANIMIGTYQSLEKRPKQWFEQFYGVGIDECLHPDSMISMADNTKKKISEIQIGDLVKTINEKTSQIEIKPVDFIYKNLSKNQKMYELETEDGKILKITGNHKVRIKGNKEWKRVDELTINDEILDLNNDN